MTLDHAQPRADVVYEEACPFDDILARTPYLVLPKLAIQAMRAPWRKRLAALLDEAAAAGLETPSYLVFRDDPAFTHCTFYVDTPDEVCGAEIVVADPWADYRHGALTKVRALCPNFQPPEPPRPTPDEMRPGLDAAVSLLRRTADAKETSGRGVLGGMFADQAATDLRQAADRVDVLDRASEGQGR